MAVVSLPTTVLPGADAVLRQGTAGVVIAAGEAVFLDATDNRYKLADADASAASAAAVGIAINSAQIGQPVYLVTEGTLTGASGLATGQTYVLANVAGDLATALSDLTEDTSRVTFMGIGLSTTSLRVKVVPSGVVMNLA
jgi:hypothetical protein